MKDDKNFLPIVVAEAGINHNGSLQTAFELVQMAADSGADYVKFQTYNPSRLLSRETPLAGYQDSVVADTRNQNDLLESCAFTAFQFRKIRDFCDVCGIGFLSTAFDLESLGIVCSLAPDLLKIPSGEITNWFLLKAIAARGLPVLMSTGMASDHEIRNAINTLIDHGLPRDAITLLHCISEYPAPEQNLCLTNISRLKEVFGLNVGYSDHSLGITAAVAATALGATVIEKHITLDSSSTLGPDHLASIEISDLKRMISEIGRVRKMIGHSLNRSSVEMENALVVRKSIFVSKSIAPGDEFSETNLEALRPAYGISPMEVPNIVGRKSLVSLEAGELLKREHFEN